LTVCITVSEDHKTASDEKKKKERGGKGLFFPGARERAIREVSPYAEAVKGGGVKKLLKEGEGENAYVGMIIKGKGRFADEKTRRIEESISSGEKEGGKTLRQRHIKGGKRAHVHSLWHGRGLRAQSSTRKKREGKGRRRFATTILVAGEEDEIYFLTILDHHKQNFIIMGEGRKKKRKRRGGTFVHTFLSGGGKKRRLGGFSHQKIKSSRATFMRKRKGEKGEFILIISAEGREEGLYSKR